MTFRLLPEEAPVELPKPEKSVAIRVAEGAAENARPLVRTGVNLTGLAAGLPGDILSLLNHWVAGPAASLLTGEEAIPYEQTPIGKIIPTSQQTTAALRSVGPKYLNPRNQIEDFADSVVNDTALLFSPGKTKVPFAGTVSKGLRLLRSFATSLGANVAAKGVEDFSGGDKGKGAYTKIGSIFLLSLLDKPKAARMAAQLYKDAEAALPQGATASASKLESSLNSLKSKVQKGTIAPSEKFIIDEVEAVLNKVKNGKISIDEAWASKRSLNEKLNQHLFQNPEKAAQARARKLASGIQQELSDVLQDYGKNNPKFYENFKNAEEVFGTIAQSRFFSNFIRKNVKHFSPSDSALLHLLGSGAGSAIGASASSLIGGAAPLAAAGAVVYPATQLWYRIFKSPVLRKHYLNTMNAVAQENTILFQKEYNRLKEEIEKDKKKDKFRLVD